MLKLVTQTIGHSRDVWRASSKGWVCIVSRKWLEGVWKASVGCLVGLCRLSGGVWWMPGGCLKIVLSILQILQILLILSTLANPSNPHNPFIPVNPGNLFISGQSFQSCEAIFVSLLRIDCENDFQGEGATLTAAMAYGLLCGAFYCINLLSKKRNEGIWQKV